MTPLTPLQSFTEAAILEYGLLTQLGSDSTLIQEGEPAPEGWREWVSILFPNYIKHPMGEHHVEIWEHPHRYRLHSALPCEQPEAVDGDGQQLSAYPLAPHPEVAFASSNGKLRRGASGRGRSGLGLRS